MTTLTPERLAAIRARTTMATVLLPDGDVLALLDAAEERDRLAAKVWLVRALCRSTDPRFMGLLGSDILAVLDGAGHE